MRTFFYLIFSSLFCLQASAQRITGNITDLNGKSVEYVNVGVQGTSVGVFSDGKGCFIIDIPDSLRGYDVIFSHVSFDPLVVPVRDFLVADSLVPVRLSEKSIPMREVTVLSGKPKYKRVRSGTVRMRHVFLTPMLREMNIDVQNQSVGSQEKNAYYFADYHAEAVSVLKIRERMRLDEVSFPVLKISYDSLLVRINLYEKEDETFTPVHTRPIYVMLDRKDDGEPHFIDVDIKEEGIVVSEGELCVGLEIILYYGDRPDIRLGLAAYAGGGYYNSGVGQYEKIPFNPGIQVYGRLLR